MISFISEIPVSSPMSIHFIYHTSYDLYLHKKIHIRIRSLFPYVHVLELNASICAIYFLLYLNFRIFSVVTVQPNCEFLKISSTDYMRVIEVWIFDVLNIPWKLKTIFGSTYFINHIKMNFCTMYMCICNLKFTFIKYFSKLNNENTQKRLTYYFLVVSTNFGQNNRCLK